MCRGLRNCHYVTQCRWIGAAFFFRSPSFWRCLCTKFYYEFGFIFRFSDPSCQSVQTFRFVRASLRKSAPRSRFQLTFGRETRTAAALYSILPAPWGRLQRNELPAALSSIHPRRPLVAFHLSPPSLTLSMLSGHVVAICPKNYSAPAVTDNWSFVCFPANARQPFQPSLSVRFKAAPVFMRGNMNTPDMCCKHGPICQPNLD